MKRMFSVAAAVTAVLAGAALAETPDLHVTLGGRNEEAGLHVPSGGDGQNAPGEAAGVSVRRVAGERSLYLYAVVDHPSYRQGPVDVYVSAEVFDDTVARVTLQYDQASEHPNLGTRYASSEETYLLLGSQRWRTLRFCLPQARLRHGQNFGADFRFFAPGVAFKSVTVSTRCPAGFPAQQPVDAEALRQVAVTRPAGMEVTFGNDASAADAALFKALSVSSVESYVDWAGVEPQKGQWDWSRWDKQVAVLRTAGIKWVPFLIAGPAYATPLWFQASPDSHVYRCLEHGRDSKVQSLFNPALRPQVARFIHAFADRYRDTGVIESVLLGITGIYGESIYPAGPEGGWTARLTGDYHNHLGWWAGDAYAVQAFRAAMSGKYGRIKRLNAAWGTAYAAFDKVAPFLPEKAPNDRACADFVEWYQQAMIDWAVFWAKTAREAFPDTEIYLCTGGDGKPRLGADFTAQTAAVARYGVGVRITNEGSDYAHNFSVTREVATATRQYGTFCGFEPASKVDAKGVAARIYNATASGAHQLHDYIPNTLGQSASLANFRTNIGWLAPRVPQVRTALYLSRETWAVDPDAVGRTLSLSRTLRDAVDLDFVTRRSLADGYLKQCDTLVLGPCSVLEPKSAETIEAWVRKGGFLVAATRPDETVGGRLYDHAAWRRRLFSEAVPEGPLMHPALGGDAPAHWILHVGSSEDEGWLGGDWNSREKGHEWPEIPDATMRWSGARPGVWLPVKPGASHTVRISLSVPKQALGPAGIAVTVNGKSVGRVTRPGRQTCAFALPADMVAPNGVVYLECVVAAWRPSERDASSRDSRALGMSVRQVEVTRAGSDSVSASAAAIRLIIDRRKLEPLTRPVGQGRTLMLRGRADDERLMAAVLPVTVDGAVDGRFATETDDGVLWFDSVNGRIEKSVR